MIAPGRVAAGIDQQQVVHDCVELVPLKPGRVIDQRAVTAEFLDEDAVTQALRGVQIMLVGCETDGQPARIGLHDALPCGCVAKGLQP